MMDDQDVVRVKRQIADLEQSIHQRRVAMFDEDVAVIAEAAQSTLHEEHGVGDRVTRCRSRMELVNLPDLAAELPCTRPTGCFDRTMASDGGQSRSFRQNLVSVLTRVEPGPRTWRDGPEQVVEPRNL